MNAVTHALTVNGRTDIELKDRFDPPETVLRKALSRLDGSDFFALMLWALPKGAELDEVDLPLGPEDYIQAGGCRERMTVEVRRLEGNEARQYVVGRETRASEEDEPLTEVIHWDESQATVRPSEVFSADQAADIFIAYYATGWIPDSYTLRKLDL